MLQYTTLLLSLHQRRYFYCRVLPRQCPTLMPRVMHIEILCGKSPQNIRKKHECSKNNAETRFLTSSHDRRCTFVKLAQVWKTSTAHAMRPDEMLAGPWSCGHMQESSFDQSDTHSLNLNIATGHNQERKKRRTTKHTSETEYKHQRTTIVIRKACSIHEILSFFFFLKWQETTSNDIEFQKCLKECVFSTVYQKLMLNILSKTSNVFAKL